MISAIDKAGYGELAVGLGDQLAVVVVDFQTAFLQSDYPMGGFPEVSQACLQTAKLLKAVRAANIPVTCCYIGYEKEAEIPRWKIPSLYRDFFEGGQGTQLDERIVDTASDYVFRKTAPSAFFNTSLHPHFQSLQIDTVIITGCVTSGCIRATAVDSFPHGYRTVVLDDCCGDPNPERHAGSLRDLALRYADILSSQELLAAIQQNAAVLR